MIATEVEHVTMIINLTDMTRYNTASWVLEAPGDMTISI